MTLVWYTLAMELVCLDLEGVLVPEIWLGVAERTGIEALKRTTRDEPDYSKLMSGRIEILKSHNLTLRDIQEVIGSMKPLPGALDFLDELRRQTQVIILSDTCFVISAILKLSNLECDVPLMPTTFGERFLI